MLLDRANSRPLIMASTEGGMDIEEVAEKSPEKIFKEWIDPAVGIMPFQARKIAAALGLKGDLFNAGAKFVTGVYNTWWECDAAMVEINPMCVVELADGKETVMALDAKISLDDNALYRHKDIQEMRDLNEEAPLEIEASKFNLNYIKLDGNIACLVNGAGLAMATMDIIQYFGGSPANFLDVGGGASKEQVTAAFKIILQRPEREGHPGEHLWRHHGLRRHRRRHRRGGEGDALENSARRPAGGQQCRGRQKNAGRIRPGHHQRRLDGRRGAEGGQGGQQLTNLLMLKVTEIAFTCYPVTDMARAREFYEGVLGLKPRWCSANPAGCSGGIRHRRRHARARLRRAGLEAALGWLLASPSKSRTSTQPSRICARTA